MIPSLVPQRPPPPSVTESFATFWAFYLSVHQHPWTRRCHAAATVFGMACVLFVYPLTQDADWLLIGPAGAYSLAWFSHFAFEKKPPAMLAHPLWALVCDLRMVRLYASDRLDGEWARVQGEPPPAPASVPAPAGSLTC